MSPLFTLFITNTIVILSFSLLLSPSLLIEYHYPDASKSAYYPSLIDVFTGVKGLNPYLRASLELNYTLPNVYCRSLNLQFADLRIAFSMIDKDGDDHISSKELLLLMKMLVVDTNSAAAKKMIRVVDLDGT